MANLNISITIDSKQAEGELRKFQEMLFGMAKNFENLKKSLGFGDETIKEAQKLSKSIQSIETNVKQVTQTTADLSKTAKEGFAGIRQEVEKTQKGFIGLQWNLKSILTDAVTLMNFQLRWYAARQIIFGVPRAIKAGIGFEAEIDKAQAMLLRYAAMEGQVRDIHRQVVEEITTYARQLAINLPITFEEIIKSADRLLAAGASIDTVKGSLESFAKLQVAFPEIEPEKFTTAIIGFLNTFRKTPGLKEFENDAVRIQVILDKLTVALAKGVIAPKDINVVIQHLGQMSQAAGFSIDQMLALSVMVTNLGSKAGPAARALRGLIDSLATPKGIENLEKIGVHLDRSRTIAEQFKTIIEGLRKAVGTGEQGLTLGSMEFLRGIAPTERRSALIALIRELETYQNLVDAISQSEGALNRTSEVMTNTLSGQWQILKNLTKELGAALINSEALKSGLGFLTNTLKVLGFWLSGIAGVLSIVIDGFKWLWHSIAEVTNPIERLLTALMKAATGDLKGAWQEIMRTPKVYYEHEEKAAEALKGSLERAAKETKNIQDVLFGKSKFTGGKDELKGGGMAGGGVPLPGSEEEIKVLRERLRNEHDIYKDHLQALKELHEEGIAAMEQVNKIAAEQDRSRNEQLKADLDDRSWLIQTFYREELTNAQEFYEQKKQVIEDSLQGELTLIKNETGRQLDVLTQKYTDAQETWWDLANRYDEVWNQMQGITDKKALKYLENDYRDLEIQLTKTTTEMTKLQTNMQVLTEQGFNKQAEAVRKYDSELLKLNYDMQVASAVLPLKQQEWNIGQQRTYNEYLLEAAELTGSWNEAEKIKLNLLKTEAALTDTNYQAQIARLKAEADFIDAYLEEAQISDELFNYLSNVSQALRDQVPILQQNANAWRNLQDIKIGLQNMPQWKRGLNNLYNQWTDTGKQMEQIATQTASALQETFSTYFFDYLEDDLKRLEDRFGDFGVYIANFLRSIVKSLSDILSQRIVSGLLSPLFGNLGGSNVTFPSSLPPVGTPVTPGGGGYLNYQHGTDYVPRTGLYKLHQGEEVRPAGSKSNPQDVKIQVNIENKSSAQVQGKTSNVQFDGKQYIVGILLEDYDSYGPVRRMYER
jgi:TP901 family phage tail tape measure protein